MRIGVNAVPLRVQGGGARYCFTNLLEAMLECEPDHEYIVFTHFLGLPVVSELCQAVAHLQPQPRIRVVEVATEQDVLKYGADFDVYFAPLNNLQPRIFDRPTVAILHDIQEQFFPQFFSKGDLDARREIYPEICRAATVLVTISEFCKQSIVEKFDIDPAKIEVVYNAPQRSLVDRGRQDVGVWREAPLPARFIFYPGNFYPHKNHLTLLDAVARLRERDSSNVPHVVLTGFEMPGGPRMRKEIEARGLTDLCHVFAKVDEDALRYLFAHARALVMPTRFEGFGMPAVEALASGCPFIGSDIPPLREIAGDAAVYFSPDDHAKLAEHIEQFTATDMRNDPMTERGRRRAADFCWQKSARRMLEILEDAPRRFLGFTPGPGRRAPDDAPSVGVMILADRGDVGIPESLKSIWSTGYPHIQIEAVARHQPFSQQCKQLLDSVPVANRSISNGATEIDLLLDFAERTEADLVGQIWSGNGLTAAALHSLCQARLQNPDALVFLGESWVLNSAAIITESARLRLRADGWWSLEGYLFPEMIFFRPEALRQARSATSSALLDERWRWELVKRMRHAGKLCLMRRTLGASHQSSATFWQRLRSSLDAGVPAEHAQSRSLMSRAEPAFRFASRVLPRAMRTRGRRVWDHLKQR